MQKTLDIEVYKKNVLRELVSYVNTASGQIRDKEHWMAAVTQSLYKLKPLFKYKDGQQ
jgi:hypothetical protein